MGPHEPSSIGKGYWTFVQGPGFEPGMPTYSPLRGEFFAVRLPDKKKTKKTQLWYVNSNNIK
jgi:hypothetical protein